MKRALALGLSGALVLLAGASRADDDVDGGAPAPEPAPAVEPAPAPAPPEPPPPPKRYAQPEVGYYLAGLGGTSIAVGSIFGIGAFRTRDLAEREHCNGGCSPRAVTLNEHAMTYAWAANITIGVGVALLAGGIYLLLRKPSTPATAAWNSF